MKKIILPHPFLGFIPIGIKPNVYVSDNIFNNYSIELYNNNFVLIDTKLSKLIEDLSINIIFPYDYKSLPDKNIDSNYNDVSYKIDNTIYDIHQLYTNCIDLKHLFPYMILSEEDLFYMKLNDASIAFMD